MIELLLIAGLAVIVWLMRRASRPRPVSPPPGTGAGPLLASICDLRGVERIEPAGGLIMFPAWAVHVVAGEVERRGFRTGPVRTFAAGRGGGPLVAVSGWRPDDWLTVDVLPGPG